MRYDTKKEYLGKDKISHITTDDIESNSPAEHFVNHALAYLESAVFLLENIEKKTFSDSFYHAQVTAFLFQHSLELFLKGALLFQSTKYEKNHKLKNLYDSYKAIYSDERFAFNSQIDLAVKEDPDRPYSIYARYPYDKNDNFLWKGFSLNVQRRLKFFNDMICDFKRIICQIKISNQALDADV